MNLVDREFFTSLVLSESALLFSLSQEQASTPWLGNYKPAPSRLPTPSTRSTILLAGVSEQLTTLSS